MHPLGTRVLTPVASAARVSIPSTPAACASRAQRRPFFSWPGPPNNNGNGDGSGADSSGGNGNGGSNVEGGGGATNGSSNANDSSVANASSSANSSNGKPAQEAVTEDDVETHAATDAAGGRSRSHVTAAQRSRQARRRAAAALPPVKLPRSFLDYNVSLYTEEPPELPFALAYDAKIDKVSRLFQKTDRNPGPNPHNDALQFLFKTAVDDLLTMEAKIFSPYDRPPTALPLEPATVHPIADLVRIWDMIIDASWHLTDALYPARLAEYTYQKRPFWWWAYYRDYNRGSFDVRPCSLGLSLDLRTQRRLDTPLAHSMADLPLPTVHAVMASIQHDVTLIPAPELELNTFKRQITIVALTGYSGRGIPEALARHVAYGNGLHLVSLDAYDLAALVGDYLGQNMALARGPLSMLGFRAAELNGKIARDPDFTSRSAEDDDPDPDTAFINVRAATGQLDEELQKIKQGSYECFSKWDNLKIDKILDHIIQLPLSISPPTDAPKGRLIHIQDYAELSMTLEGAWLIGRLRALVDAAAQQGNRIAILGTSSTVQPSDEFHNTVRDLAVEDFVISRHLEPDRADVRTRPKGIASDDAFHLQKAENFVENVQNINRMMQAIDPNTPHLMHPAQLIEHHLEWSHFKQMQESILPIPEVYSMALSHLTNPARDPYLAVAERGWLGSLRDRPGASNSSGLGGGSDKFESDQPKINEEATSEGRAPKLSEYEKRIAAGQINRENLKVTFADVHAPAETISALKLLTSLALTRPDAFSYGVLASDKIPGCLLYGPPGTGKTMLAKAVAKESGANMLEISGATINDKWVGEGEKLIRAVFTLAKKLSPCVVFIDEADSLLGSRNMFSRASHRELINQFLKEWDGIQETNAFIMVATNRPFDLDDAVLRRLPRKILVDLPMRDDRAAILKLLLRGETLDSSVSLEEYAERTPFYSGSDLKNVCVAAAMAAVEEENLTAAKHTGPEAYQYPQRRTLRRDHFEVALKQIPASISEDMVSLKQIRKFDEEYGRQKKGGKKSMGFGVVEDVRTTDSGQARIRQGAP